MSQSSTTSRYLDGLRQGDNQAFQRICDRYYDQLSQIAERKLGGRTRRVVDEFAIANEVLHEFLRRTERGDFAEVTNHDELLPLLIRLTHDRVVDEIRRFCAQKRGGGQTRGDSVMESPSKIGEMNGHHHFRGLVETPSTRQILADELDAIMKRLPDEKMQAILMLRSEGYTEEEMAEELDVSVATIQRKRRRIKDLLRNLASDH